MSGSAETVPVVMCFAGLDPTGGAGLQADIESVAGIGCRAAPVITVITVQDTQNVVEVAPVAAMQVAAQGRAVLHDMTISAFKVGLISNVATVEALHGILREHPDIPVVLDPVLVSGAGKRLCDDDTLDAMVSLLFPFTTILTPNGVEARLLAPEADSLGAAAAELLSYGCQWVLLTGTHEDTPKVVNTLYSAVQKPESFPWPRLPDSYHGSGCTLSAAIAAMLAQGADPVTAVHKAQRHTWLSLESAHRPGSGQSLPNRFYWAGSGQSQP